SAVHARVKLAITITPRWVSMLASRQQNGDSYLIQEKDVRRFILEHPTDIDLRKVDQLWFLDVITSGLNLLRKGAAF
ncbi:MAG TPA: hypothetical protein VF772_23250, partial [Terriglobales bacterium]